MATACDSDRESVGPMTAVSPAAGAVSSFGERQYQSTTCVKGFFTCCNNQIHDETKLTSYITPEHFTLDLNGLDEMDDNCAQCSRIIPLLTDYYNYTETIRQALINRDIGLGQVQDSLQYMACLARKPAKQMVFSPSSSLATATDFEGFLSALGEISSWYNNNWFTFIVRLYIEEPKRTEIIERYEGMISRYSDTIMSLVPTLSTSVTRHDDFEELDVFMEHPSSQYTLKDVAALHDNVADLLGLKRHVVLLQSLTRDDATVTNGSRAHFWFPKVVSSTVAGSVLTSTPQMERFGIAQIRTRYETISLPHIHNISADVVTKNMNDSGYDTHCSNGSPNSSNLTDKLSIFYEEDDEEDEDEVFITPPSPGLNTITSDITISDVNSDSNTESCFSSEHTIIPPPPGYTASSCNIASNSSSTCTVSEPTSGSTIGLPNQLPGGCARIRGISVDDEILEEYERQSSILTTLGEATRNEDTDQPTVTMVTLVQHNSRLSNAQKGRPPPSQAPPTSPPSMSQRTPLSSTQDSPSHAPTFYRIVCDSKPTNFVKRVLLRASPARPANLHMVTISSLSDTAPSHGTLPVTLGEKLTALYANGSNIMAVNGRDQCGIVPYSLCRLSRTYYGKNSVAIKLSQTQLFSVSTLNIREYGSSPSRGGSPVYLDLIVVKTFLPQSREQLSVEVGDKVRLLYCDDNWIYAANKMGGAGFVPRDHCRLVHRSAEVLKKSKWACPSLPFQSDFVFNLTQAPPPYLVMNISLPNELNGKIIMVTRNFTPYGCLHVVRRGTRVKALYSDGNNFVFVATISGTSFWLPLALCIVAPVAMTMPHFGLAKSTDDVFDEPVSAPGVLRPRAQTAPSDCATPSTKKKVTFAIDMPTQSSCDVPSQSHDVPSQSCDALELDSGHVPIGRRRTRSEENIPVFMLFSNESPVPSNIFTGCFSFCF